MGRIFIVPECVNVVKASGKLVAWSIPGTACACKHTYKCTHSNKTWWARSVNTERIVTMYSSGALHFSEL